MSGKDQSVVSKDALMSTKPGKQILKQGLFKSKGFKMFNRYKGEAEAGFPDFVQRFARDLHGQIMSDSDPAETQQAFGQEVDSPEMILDASQIGQVRSNLAKPAILMDRVLRILNSNFVKMTFPVFNALFDAASGYTKKDDPELRRDIVEGHILAIDLSEPMDRIVDKDEDLEFLDDYKLMNPYILRLAREKISRGGKEVLEEFERGFRDARVGQDLDEKLKSKPTEITEEEMTLSYKKVPGRHGHGRKKHGAGAEAAGGDILPWHGKGRGGCRMRQRDGGFHEERVRQDSVVAAVLLAACRRCSQGL